jgi:hypothetical protein
MVAASLVAVAFGRPVWAACLGAGLVLVYWALEALSWRRAAHASFNGAIAVALGGSALRLAAVLGALIAVGLLARDAFATAALSFLAAFTVYAGLRLFMYPAASSAEAPAPVAPGRTHPRVP